MAYSVHFLFIFKRFRELRRYRYLSRSKIRTPHRASECVWWEVLNRM